MKKVLKIPANEKPIAFYPIFARVFGDVERALYIQQLLYWSDKGKRDDGFIYKTKGEIQEETTLTPYQQDRCRKYFEKIGVLETKLLKANGSPTLHYKVNIEILQTLIFQYQETQHSNVKKLDIPISRNSTFEYQGSQETLTENTTEITQRDTTEITNPTHHPLKSGENSSSIRKNAKGYTLEDKKGFFGQGQSYINEVATIVANKLADVLGSIYKVKHSDKIINGWKKSIYTFLKNHEGIEVERLLDVIEWYGKHYNEQYIPKITDAKTFCNKFFALESSYLKRLKSKVGIRNVDLDGV